MFNLFNSLQKMQFVEPAKMPPMKDYWIDMPKPQPVKTFMIVANSDVDDILIALGIKIIDGVNIEKYRIYSVRCCEDKACKLVGYNWCVNISKGY